MPSVVIHRYLKVAGDGVGKAKAHVKYIQHRRGEDKERSPDDPTGPKRRELFDGERDSLDRRELNDLIDREREGGGMTRHKVAMHKLTLSPGIQGVDLKEYTREVMDALGKEKGLDLVWGAAAHRNTDHDHVHVVILGTDANGQRVRINRDDHDLLRYKSDQYLEREHAYDRGLEREAQAAERISREQGLERDSVNERLDRLFGKSSERDRVTQEERQPWTKERALEEMPDWQKITVQDREYTRYDSKDDLKALDEHLKTHYEDRVEKREYAMLQRWIEAKEHHGDKCHERWDKRDFDKKEREGKDGREAHREWHELDKNARKFVERQEFVLQRHMPRSQRLLEERGRFTEFHCTYQNLMARKALMDARERSQDPEVHKYVDKEIEWLKEQQQEAMRDVPLLDLDSLYGKNAERDRDKTREREPEKALNLDEIEFPDLLKDPTGKEETKSKEKGREEEGKDSSIGQDKREEKDQNREQESVPEKGREAGDQTSADERKQGQDETADTANQERQQTDERTQDLTDAQHGQEMHEQTVFKQKIDEREEDEREQDERER